jgi:hypothetical protein
MRSLGSRFFPNQSESTPVPTSLSASSYTYPTPVWMKSDTESDAAMQRCREDAASLGEEVTSGCIGEEQAPRPPVDRFHACG